MSVSINIDNVVKKYGDKTIIEGLSVDIKPGEFFTLLGPSGCGKTTLLRMIIGFNSIEGGEIRIDEKLINNIPTNKRNMGMVFQNYAIFPHMSVKDNVAFGLKNQKLPKAEMEKRIDEILDIVKITEFKDRMPDQLSGGQQQRVALARAIVIHPQVLLMDEPLSNLDAKLRVEMRNAIKDIQKQVGITTVYVTHDQEEALAVSDRIAIMKLGEIQQVASPREIYERPKNLFVSNFIGTSNTLVGELKTRENNRYLSFGQYEEKIDTLIENAVDGKVKVAIRPQEFFIVKSSDGIEGTIEDSIFLGVNTHYYVKLNSGETVEVIQDIDTVGEVKSGEKVYLKLKPKKINIFDYDTEETIIKAGDIDEK